MSTLTLITILVPAGLFAVQGSPHRGYMSLTDSLAILAGWLTIAPLRNSSGARRYLLAIHRGDGDYRRFLCGDSGRPVTRSYRKLTARQYLTGTAPSYRKSFYTR